MLEKMKPEYYTVDQTYNHYNLRQPGIRIPAVGFDQGSSRSNGWIYGNAFGYRTEEGMKENASSSWCIAAAACSGSNR